MTEFRIPFNKPFVAGKELYYIAQAVAFGNLAGDGPFTLRCQEILKERTGAYEVLLTPSCTAALEMAALLFDVGPGDEVIVPSYTFVSTANAFALRGARLVFVDIRRDTLNIDEELIEVAITNKTKAICPTHYAGVGCEMERIMEIAADHGLRVIEDAAQGVNASYRGRPLGSIAELGTFSFHETKNYICGEGGALLINDPSLLERAEIIRDKGTNRKQFLRGNVDKYTWVDLGSSYVPSEIVSAFLCGQLEELVSILERRKEAVEFYDEQLRPLIVDGFLQGPSTPDDCIPNYHMYYVLLPDRSTRDKLMAHLHSRGILAVFHYVPLHTSPMGRRFGVAATDLPVTEDIAGRLLRLPLYHELSREEQGLVVREVREFLQRHRCRVTVASASPYDNPEA